MRITEPVVPLAVEELLPPAGRSVRTAQRRYLSSTSPWRSRDLARSATLAVVGIVAGGCCWYGASQEERWRDQIGWVLGALLGLTVIASAGATWLVAGFRELRHGMRDLEVDKNAVFGLGGSAAPDEQHPGATLVTAPGMTRVHLSDCLLVRGKAVEPAGRSARDLPRCGVCLP